MWILWCTRVFERVRARLKSRRPRRTVRRKSSRVKFYNRNPFPKKMAPAAYFVPNAPSHRLGEGWASARKQT